MIANPNYAGGVFSMDQVITNARGAISTDKTVYGPIEFRIKNISGPTVTVKNSDAASPAPTFIYNRNFALGESASRRFEFNAPCGMLFTFDAEIRGLAIAGSTTGTGSQAGDGTPEQAPPPTLLDLPRGAHRRHHGRRTAHQHAADLRTPGGEGHHLRGCGDHDEARRAGARRDAQLDGRARPRLRAAHG